MGDTTVTNPGVVNVADEAYPFPPGGSQGLPVPSSVSVAAGAFPAVPGGSQGLPVPSFTEVETVPFKPPSFSLGAATPATPTTDVGTQSLAKPNPDEWLVTESGNFKTNNTADDLQSFVQLSIVTIDSGLPTEMFQIFFTAPVNLFSFGLDLTGMIAFFPTSAKPKSPENVPSRPIINYSTNWILVANVDQFGNALDAITAPTNGGTVQIAISREGPDVIVQGVNTPTNVTIAPAPPVAQTVPAQGLPSLGNLQANDGVVVPFVGSGVQLPPLLGTFEVENQVPIGTGLPANVFVP
jgi:hypothetical protein